MLGISLIVVLCRHSTRVSADARSSSRVTKNKIELVHVDSSVYAAARTAEEQARVLVSQVMGGKPVFDLCLGEENMEVSTVQLVPRPPNAQKATKVSDEWVFETGGRQRRPRLNRFARSDVVDDQPSSVGDTAPVIMFITTAWRNGVTHSFLHGIDPLTTKKQTLSWHPNEGVITGVGWSDLGRKVHVLISDKNEHALFEFKRKLA